MTTAQSLIFCSLINCKFFVSVAKDEGPTSPFFVCGKHITSLGICLCLYFCLNRTTCHICLELLHTVYSTSLLVFQVPIWFPTSSSSSSSASRSSSWSWLWVRRSDVGASGSGTTSVPVWVG